MCYALSPSKVSPLPAKIGASKACEECSTLFGFQKDVKMCPYVLKKWQNRLIMHFNAIISDGTRNKPEFINYYNSTKDYIDRMDRMLADYSSANN